MIKTEIGKQIRQIRVGLGMNQTEFGKKLGLVTSSVCDYEKGNTAPSFEVLSKIATFGKISIDDLLLTAEGRTETQMLRPESWNSWLSTFALNERRYVETELERYISDMRVINTPLSRRPETLKGIKFTTQLFTAVSAAKAGKIRYLICVERVA